MVAVSDASITWTEATGHTLGGTYHGAEEIISQVFARTVESWSDFRVEVAEMHESGDRVIAIGTYSATARQTGTSIRARVVHVWMVRDGRIIEFEQVADTYPIALALGCVS